MLFELATDGPGFAVDEDPQHLGESLVLPPWLESQRQQIAAILPPLTYPTTARASLVVQRLDGIEERRLPRRVDAEDEADGDRHRERQEDRAGVTMVVQPAR